MKAKSVLKLKSGQVVKRYSSTRQAEIFEPYSHQLISNRCNGIVKSDYLDEFQFRWG